ncbi:Tlg2-vesicle protein [Penicillium chermesinum]|nr:Tlg2-vesicle protein [Penicillium chermesinum]
MPADYESTARALAVSTSPDLESPENDDEQPLWGHGRRNSRAAQAASTRDQLISKAKMFYRKANERWERMTFWQKGVGFMVFTGKVFFWLGPVAERWEKSPLVAFVLWLCVFFVSFPPLVGWSTFGTVAGFIFGLWKGLTGFEYRWLIYATATILGSTASFYVSRTVLSSFVNRLMERDKRFAALALTLKYDGLKLLCMIRLCPLPYSICNGAVSTFPTVQPLTYGLATAIISPKLLVPAFIGSRVRLLSEKGEEMSAGSKAVNIISIIVTVSIGVGTGFYIYRRTLARAKELEEQERADIRQSLQNDHAAHRPHGRFSDDDDVNTASNTLARDEEERIGFGDLDDDNVDLGFEDDSGSETSKVEAIEPEVLS